MTSYLLTERKPNPPHDDVPSVVSSLIDSAVTALDADPDASRRCLVRASAILRAHTGGQSRTGTRPPFKGGLARWQLDRVLDHIEQHLAEPLSGTRLATVIDVSVGQLFRAFKASVGLSPLRYIAARRLELACVLLRTTRHPLSDIAIASGFFDQSHLCRVFRRSVRSSPAAWRRANAADPAAARPRAGAAGGAGVGTPLPDSPVQLSPLRTNKTVPFGTILSTRKKRSEVPIYGRCWRMTW